MGQKERAATFRARNRERIAASSKRQRDELRAQALTHYGGTPPTCACCGEATIQFLTIDHVGGGGNAERASIGSKGGTEFYRWLRQRGWPAGYRVLCHNCNAALGAYGACPHGMVQDPPMDREPPAAAQLW